jgi:hypothetical protein
MSQIVLAETASVDTPSSGLVAVFADNSANPQMKFTDDAGNTRTIADNNNTVTMANKTFTAPNIGAATGTSLAVSGAVTSSGTAGIGYATGAGGTVVQATSKVTAFTLSKTTGTIQFAADALGGDTTTAGATWTNTTIAANDIVVFMHISGGTLGAYNVACTCAAGSATIRLRNLTAGSLSEAPVFRFAVIKSVNA